ncbi:glycosyltransferase family 2 protein [Micromonospora sp. HUAS LYJ1]|uniref:glycosyltransferase family 2 protein n=1 Tax=Micromonospora sp. HUAS LYJ1 TaxID=3061626 RepID=UPI0026724B5D|nr:glycosyltransferase [Micromonospora sp. HUAS LYJ1]WKU07181.1 glycosyltransferase [Micromonospora sp. HUAS LYJ1]
MTTPTPQISVVIPSHVESRFGYLVEAIAVLRAQSPAPAEIIVVVDHNPALFERASRELTGVTVLENRFPPGVSGTRNTGATHATGPLLVFLDDDVRPAPDWLSRLIAPLADPTVVGAGAGIVARWETRQPRWLPDEFLWAVGASYRGLPTSTARVRNVWSGSMAVRRGPFLAAGGFRTDFGKVGDRSRPEDTELCLRLARHSGGHWVHVPDAVISHPVQADRATFRYFLVRCLNEGRGKILMARLLGTDGALAAEQRYLRSVLPRAVLRGITGPLRGAGPRPALRAGAVLAGLLAAALGAILELLSRHPADSPSEVRPADPAGIRSNPTRPRLPALVRDIELTEPLPHLPSVAADGRRIQRAWLLVRLHTEPIGSVLLDVPEAGLAPAELSAAIDTNLGTELRRRLPAGWPVPPPDDLSAGLPPAGGSAQLRRRAEVLRDPPPITVVVCTRERPEELARCLDSLLAQPYPNFRVLVVDNAPTTDATRAVVARAASRGPVERIVEPRPGLSFARNRAVTAAPGEILAWIDDDEVADPHWLSEVARALADHPEADVVSGVIVPAELETDPQLWFESFGGHSKGRGYTPDVFSPATAARQSPLYPLPPFGTGANMTFRPGVIERIGGFDTALGAGTPAMGSEDTLAFTRVLLTGGTVVYHPAAVVRHYHRRDLDGLRKQLVGYGTGLTAAYTGLVLTDPATLLPLLRLAPTALRDLHRPEGPRLAGIGTEFPRELLAANRRGMLRGPAAYLRGRRRARRPQQVTA